MSNTRDATSGKGIIFPSGKHDFTSRVKSGVAFLTTWSVLRRFMAYDYTVVVQTLLQNCFPTNAFSCQVNRDVQPQESNRIQNTTIKQYIIQKTRRRKSNINQT